MEKGEEGEPTLDLPLLVYFESLCEMRAQGGTLRARSRAVYTYAKKYLAWCGMRQKRAESTLCARAIGVGRDLCSARCVPLLLGTISNWPQATIVRGRARGTRIRVHTPCRNDRDQRRSGVSLRNPGRNNGV